MAVRAPLHESVVSQVLEQCTVHWWRGYVRSTFYAVDDTGSLLGESPSFRLRGSQPPRDEGPARAAFDELVGALEHTGWKAVEEDRPGSWFTATFVRLGTRSAPPERLESLEALTAPPAPAKAPPAVAAAPRPVAPAVREQPPAPVAREAQPPAPAPSGRKRQRGVQIVSGCGALVAAGVFASLLISGDRHASVTRTSLTVTTAPAAVAPAKPKHRAVITAPAAPPKPRTVRLTIAASDKASWVEVRKGSKTGRILYAAELPAGAKIHFSAARLWARFGAAGNVTVAADGRPVALTGTVEHVFAARRR
jgi:hypothetical protein